MFGQRLRVLVAQLITLMKWIDFQQLIGLLPEIEALLKFSTDREGFRNWLFTVGRVLGRISSLTPTIRDDEAVDFFIAILADDRQYERLYVMIFGDGNQRVTAVFWDEPRLADAAAGKSPSIDWSVIVEIIERILPVILEFLAALDVAERAKSSAD